MSEICGETCPDDASSICQKPAHPWGPHFSWPATVWQGIEPPVHTKKGTQRVEKVIGSMEPSGKVGPPVSGLDEGRRLRDEGMDRAIGGGDDAAEVWKRRFREVFRTHLVSGEDFCSDHLIDEIGMPPMRLDGSGRPNLVGAIFNGEVRRAGASIAQDGWAPMTRAKAHARRTPLWHGVS